LIENQHNNKIAAELGTSILNLYRRSIFGKASKLEIDLEVFAALLKIYLRERAGYTEAYDEEKDVVRWYYLNSQEIRDLSLRLRLTETRIISYIEQCALSMNLHDLNKERAIELFSELASKTNLNRSEVKEGKISLYIPNRLTRRAIEAFLAKNGGIPDTSFKNDILVVRIIDILAAIAETQVTIDFVRSLAIKAEKQYKQLKFDKSMKELDGNKLYEDSKIILNKIIGCILEAGAGAAITQLMKLAL
jgi:ribosomal protein L20A (L18A)